VAPARNSGVGINAPLFEDQKREAGSQAVQRLNLCVRRIGEWVSWRFRVARSLGSTADILDLPNPELANSPNLL
jgi:hypothetical protein